MSKLFLSNVFHSLLVSTIFFFFTFFYFPVIPGWIDDVSFINGLDSVFYNEANNPIHRTFYFVFDIFLFIQKQIPIVNIFSFVMYFMMYVGVFYINRTLFIFLKSELLPYKYFISFYLNFIFLIDLFILNTFTTTSTLLFVLSFLQILHNPKNILYFFILLFSFSIRPEVALFTFILLFIYIIALRKKMFIGIIYLTILIFVFLSFLRTDSFLDLKRKFQNEVGSDFFTIVTCLDGNNFSGKIDLENARHLALFSWFFGDLKETFNKETINEIKPFNLFSEEIILKASQKLKWEFHKACCSYPDEYTPHRNWFAKSIISLVILLIILVLLIVTIS